MAFKFVVLCSVLAIAQAGVLGQVSYAHAPALALADQVDHVKPVVETVASTHENVLRSFDGTVASHSKAIVTPYSSVHRQDTRINNHVYTPALTKTVTYAAPTHAAGVTYAHSAPVVSKSFYGAPAPVVYEHHESAPPASVYTHATPVAYTAPAVAKTVEYATPAVAKTLSYVAPAYAKTVSYAEPAVKTLSYTAPAYAKTISYAEPAVKTLSYAAPAYAKTVSYAEPAKTLSYAAPAYAKTVSYTEPAVKTLSYAAPAYAKTVSYAAPAVASTSYNQGPAVHTYAHNAPGVSAYGSSQTVHYSPAEMVSHMSFDGFGTHFDY